jgi:hypothetical protein
MSGAVQAAGHIWRELPTGVEGSPLTRIECHWGDKTLATISQPGELDALFWEYDPNGSTAMMPLPVAAKTTSLARSFVAARSHYCVRWSRSCVVLLALCLPSPAQSHQISGTLGYNYQLSDQGRGVHANLNGFFVASQFDFNDHISVVAEMDSYYGRVRTESATQQNFVIGPQYTFRREKAKARPFVYVQGGDQRSASAGNAAHAFDLQLGAGVQLSLSERVSLQLTPAEYNLALPAAAPTHSLSVKLGVSWTLRK